MEAIFILLSVAASFVVGLFLKKPSFRPMKAPTPPPKVTLADADVAAIRQQIADELRLVDDVRKGGDPDAFLDELSAKRRELDARVSKLGK